MHIPTTAYSKKMWHGGGLKMPGEIQLYPKEASLRDKYYDSLPSYQDISLNMTAYLPQWTRPHAKQIQGLLRDLHTDQQKVAE